MYFGFDLYRDDSIKDLENRLEKINAFLAERASLGTTHRHFGIFLLTPGNSTIGTNESYLVKRQSKTQYRLCIEFFSDNTSKPIPEYEIIYNLGKTSAVYDSLCTDVSAISYLSSYPEHEEVKFIKSNCSISVLFKFKDNDPNIERIKKHLEFLIPPKE